MPLQQSSSRPAFEANLKAELNAGKPKKQALAIAYSTQRKNRAAGGGISGMVSPYDPLMKPKAGGLHSPVPGRTDHLPLDVPSGSYVLPADHVSALGEGNTAAGISTLDQMFKSDGPYGVKKGGGPFGMKAPKIGGGAMKGPRGPQSFRRPNRFAQGGGIDTAITDPQPPQAPPETPIAAAGGEYIISPETVASIGGGDLEHGHNILDRWVLNTRKSLVDTLKKLPGPAKD